MIYRPETELQSSYFQAVLPEQFDEYVWVDESHAVRPIAAHQLGGALDTYPSGGEGALAADRRLPGP